MSLTRPWCAALVHAGFALALVWAPALSAQQVAGDAPGRIVVSAEGRVAAVPDMATVTLGVVAEAETARAAVDAMSADAQAVLDLLAARGLAARDVQTRGLSLQPRYSRSDSNRTQEPEIIGYRAETAIMIRVRMLEDLGGVLDAIVSEGANQFRGLSFGLAEPGPAQDAARQAAVAEARRKAELFAEAAGVTLGPMVELTEAGGPVARPMMRADMSIAESAPVPVAEGELEVTASVRMVYAIGAN